MKNREYYINAQRQEVMRGLQRRATEALERVGIRPVLLKGFGLARLYPQPYMRSWGDIDLYVGRTAYHKGAAALREAFPEAALFEGEEEYYKHYNLTFYKPFNTAIEMHRVSMSLMHPRDERIYSQLEAKGLEQQCMRYSDGEDSWWEPEWKFNVLYVFLHSWEHWTHYSANMRQVQDLALLLTVGKPESVSYAELEAYLRTNLRKLRLTDVWKLYAYIVVNEYKVPVAQCPLYDGRVAARATAWRQTIDLWEPVEVKQTAPTNVVMRKLYTFRQRVQEARRIGLIAPKWARHYVLATVAQSWRRLLRGEVTRKWE